MAITVPSMWEMAADLLDPPAPTTLVDKARTDPQLFIDEFVWLVPMQGGEPERFRLWDFQRQVIEEIQAHDKLVVLKARQLGLSWLALAYALWLGNCHPGQTVLILNRALGPGIDLLERIRFMHKHLPDDLRTRITQDTNDQKMPQVVLSNGSRFISLPSTEDTGSGLTAQFVIADEVAKWSWPRQTFTAILATVAGGGKLLAISTAKGTHNYFSELWHGSQPGAERANGYSWVFIPSSLHPGRDDQWLAEVKANYPDDRLFFQEHPEEPGDAFQLSGDAVFTEFRRTEHHAEFTREPQWPMWRGIDFGVNNAACYWIEIQGDRIAHVAAELHVEQSTTDELAAEIVKIDKQFGLEPNDLPAGADPAGRARQSVSGEVTDHEILRRHGIADIRMVVPSAPEDRVMQIKHLLRSGRLVIDCHACPRLAEALEQAQWKTRRVEGGERVPENTYAKDGWYEHFLDAFGYGLINVWPAAGPMALTQGPQMTTPRTRRYSDSPFG